MRRWILYSAFSGQGLLLHSSDVPSETELLRAVRTYAKAFKTSGEPGDGDVFRLQEIPAHDEVDSKDFTYRAATSARMESI